MPRITKVYTRTGDSGETALGGGQRVTKNSARITAYGTVDELNSAIGAALAVGLAEPLPDALLPVQNQLFHLGSDLCVLQEDKERMPVPAIEEKHVGALEERIDLLSEDLPPLENFVLPGGSQGAAMLHLARTVCRRAERDCVTLASREEIGAQVLPYLNRLSDLLFVMARYENARRGVSDVLWNSRA